MNKIKIVFYVMCLMIGILILYSTIHHKSSDCPDSIPNLTQVLKEGIIKLDGRTYNYQMLRLESKDRPSYAIYFKNERPETIMITRPYAGISWTCELTDIKKKNVVSVKQVAQDSSIYLYNNFSVLNVFGRFYDGGDIENDVNDMLAGLEFLRGKKVGITGSSWGGFEAIYAAAKSENKPLIGTALYPPTDMESWLEWTISTNESSFKPYQERCYAATNGNYSNWSREFLAENLKTNFLIYHAYEDTLVPVNQTIQLSKLSNKVTSIIGHKKKKHLSHGEMIENYSVSPEYTVTTAYLMRGLTNDTITTLVDKRALQEINDKTFTKIMLDKNLVLYEPTEKSIIDYEKRIKILDKNYLK